MKKKNEQPPIARHKFGQDQRDSKFVLTPRSKILAPPNLNIKEYLLLEHMNKEKMQQLHSLMHQQKRITAETLKQVSTECLNSTEEGKSPMKIVQNLTESELEEIKDTTNDQKESTEKDWVPLIRPIKTLSDLSRHMNQKKSEKIIIKEPLQLPNQKNVPINAVLVGDYNKVNGKQKRIKSVNSLIKQGEKFVRKLKNVKLATVGSHHEQA